MNCFSACNEVLYCWNAKTGVISHTLKANIQDFCIGDLVYAISAKLLLVSNLSSVQKSVLPEPLTCIAASHSSLYILGGGLSGRCYLWDVTGKLLKMFDSHFQQVTRCVFSINDKFLVTSGRDSVINIYDCCDFTKVSLSGHSLAVTDLYIGYTVPPNARIYSCSLDKTVKIWDFKMLLASIIFPSALTCLCVNVAETSIFAGSSDSVIYSIDLYGKISSVMQSDESSCFKGHL
jgi:WD40 repeat protein